MFGFKERKAMFPRSAYILNIMMVSYFSRGQKRMQTSCLLGIKLEKGGLQEVTIAAER